MKRFLLVAVFLALSCGVMYWTIRFDLLEHHDMIGVIFGTVFSCMLLALSVLNGMTWYAEQRIR